MAFYKKQVEEIEVLRAVNGWILKVRFEGYSREEFVFSNVGELIIKISNLIG